MVILQVQVSDWAVSDPPQQPVWCSTPVRVHLLLLQVQVANRAMSDPEQQPVRRTTSVWVHAWRRWRVVVDRGEATERCISWRRLESDGRAESTEETPGGRARLLLLYARFIRIPKCSGMFFNSNILFRYPWMFLNWWECSWRLLKT